MKTDKPAAEEQTRKPRKSTNHKFMVQECVLDANSSTFKGESVDIADVKDTADGLKWIRENGNGDTRYRVVIVTTEKIKRVQQVQTVMLE